MKETDHNLKAALTYTCNISSSAVCYVIRDKSFKLTTYFDSLITKLQNHNILATINAKNKKMKNKKTNQLHGDAC